MPSIQVLSDTTYSTRAAEAVDTLVKTCGCPVRRSQVAGLRQIANNQPGSVKEFAEKQRQRARKRMENASQNVQLKIQNEIEFWKCVANLCDGRPPNAAWSLQHEAEAALSNHFNVEPLPAGTNLTREQQAERAATKKRQQNWLSEWRNEHYPVFFQHFCVHYLYRLYKQN